MGNRQKPPNIEVLREERENGVSVREMAKKFGCSVDAINGVFRRSGAQEPHDFDPTPEDLERMCHRHEQDLRKWHGEMEGAR